jgi:hypothetical protein
MSRVTAASITPAKIWGERKPDFYVVEGRGNAGAIAVNRLLAAGANVSWLTSAIDVDGSHYEPGSIVVAASKNVQLIVARIAGDLGLRADGVKGKPPASVRQLSTVRAAVYKPWLENTDEGWTRWVLEQYEFPFTSITNADIRAGDLRARYDVIILPSAPVELLIGGQPSDAVPREYAGGLGDEGVRALVAFVRAGGTLVCLDQAGGLAIGAFHFQIRDVAKESRDRFSCPGSIVRLDLDPSQPLAYGMTPDTAAFFAFSAAYDASTAASNVIPVARYAAKDLLISGWIEGEQVIAGQTAAVQIGVGAGRVVLLGFRTHHRGQSLATFRLLFNSILTSR